MDSMKQLGDLKKMRDQAMEVQKKLAVILTLDPLANISEDDKGMRLSNNGISQEDYILSCNINSFVEKAITEDENFLSLDAKQQKEKLMVYVKEITQKTTMNGQLNTETFEDAEVVEPTQLTNG